MPDLLIAQPDTFSFIRYQLPFVRVAIANGWTVHCCLPSDARETDLSAETGVVLYELVVPRGTGTIAASFSALLQIRSLMKEIDPDALAMIGLKTVFMGGIANQGLQKRPTVNRLLGLGYTFTSSELKAKIIRLLISPVLRSILKRPNSLTVMENSDDAGELVQLGLADKGAITVIPCGVDVMVFGLQAMPDKPVRGAYLGRMLRDKGVLDLIDALRQLKQQKVDLPFEFYGEVDLENPSALTPQELDAWQAEGLMEYKGFSNDVTSVWQENHFIVLPSYREGLPVAVLEAASCGRVVVATDVPGCRDAVIDGVTGFLVPPAASQQLAETMRDVVEGNHDLAVMGKAGRVHMVERFHSPNLAEELIDKVEDLISSNKAIGAS